MDVVENVDLDFFGLFDWEDTIRRLQYGSEFILHYKVLGRRKDDGWKVVDDDSEVMELVRVHQLLEIFTYMFEHLVDKALVVETPNNKAKKNVEKYIKNSTSDSEWVEEESDSLRTSETEESDSFISLFGESEEENFTDYDECQVGGGANKETAGNFPLL